MDSISNPSRKPKLHKMKHHCLTKLFYACNWTLRNVLDHECINKPIILSSLLFWSTIKDIPYQLTGESSRLSLLPASSTTTSSYLVWVDTLPKIKFPDFCSMLTTSKGPEVVSSTHLSRPSDCSASFTQFVCSGGTSASAIFPDGITIEEKFPWSYCIVALSMSVFSNGIAVSAKWTCSQWIHSRGCQKVLSSRLIMNSRQLWN